MLGRYACVRQNDQSDCGAAALATIALHYRRPLGLQQARDVAGTGRAGTSLPGLLEAAEKLGFSAAIMQGPYEVLTRVPLPAIAYGWGDTGAGHFVVLYEVHRHVALVADPAHGVRTLSRADFCDRWTGQVLLVVPENPPGVCKPGESDADVSRPGSTPTVDLWPGQASRGAPSTPAPAIDGYEILREAGRGGQGVVYKARQRSRDRLVALKVMRAGAGTELLARFRAEVESLACLRHPHVVRLYESGEHDGRPFFTMEFVGGGSLGEKIAGKPQPVCWAARVVEALARAVHHAHQRGIIHRDLKPGNVLLTREGTPKLIDLGLARRLGRAATPAEDHSIYGTPSYMAPEQVEGNGSEIGPATDVYGLGAVLYELLTGRPLFQRGSVLDTLHQVASQQPEPPSHWQAEVPRELEAICLKSLRKVPGQRYASAGALADALRRFRTNASHRPLPGPA
jgi:tRNA A-37 threonylcarbamoyl transferase component Bud32